MSDDIKGLHDRFDHLEQSFVAVRTEQHEMAKGLVGVSHRIDIMEVQVKAAAQRETMVVSAVNEKLDASTAMVKKLFDKFDSHEAMEAKERKERAEKEVKAEALRSEREIAARDAALAEHRKFKWWLGTTLATAVMSIALLWIGKVIAG